MIIDTTYFLLPPLQIPNAVAQPITELEPTNLQALQAAIDRVEFNFLVNCLGLEQYNELKEQFEVNGEFKPDALEKWVKLVDGDGNWGGLRNVIGQSKVSLIAYYVYYEFLKNDDVYYSNTGLVKADAANSLSINPTVHLVTTWNKFVTMYQGRCNDEYPLWPMIYYDWVGYYPNYNYSDNQQTLFSYLKANTLLYDVSYFNTYSIKNRHGL